MKPMPPNNAMRISPHLCFNGQCEVAFRHYQQVLGGQIATMLSYGDSPMAAQVEPRWHSRIIHATLKLDEYELTGVDVPTNDYQRPAGFFVTLSIADLDKTERIYRALSDGGTIGMPLQKTFWSAGFAVFTDRYGVPWEINCAQPRDVG
jgi:PhnB protein